MQEQFYISICIKNEDVSEKEYAAVSQQLSTLGVNTSMDWDKNIHMAIL